MEPTVFIYVLKDPRTGEIRYVGKAKNPRYRYYSHTSCREKNHRGNWIRALNAEGFRPVLEIIDEVLETDWPSWEAAYIEFFRDAGCALVNATNGGEGRCGPGGPCTEERRQKVSAALKGVPKSTAHRAALSASKTGKPLSVAQKEALKRCHAATRGIPKSAAHCCAMSVALKGLPKSTAHRASISASKRNRPRTVAEMEVLKAMWESSAKHRESAHA